MTLRVEPIPYRSTSPDIQSAETGSSGAGGGSKETASCTSVLQVAVGVTDGDRLTGLR
jgi:hypothetical protein